jgi:uncharacterized protein (TIGR02001 family)
MTARISPAALFSMTAACSAFAADAPVHAPAAPCTVTGHIDLVSRYYLRGATTTYGNALPALGNKVADASESDHPALQGGLGFVHESGFYAGYFASSINYSYKQLGHSYDDRNILSVFQNDKSVQNDFYAG